MGSATNSIGLNFHAYAPLLNSVSRTTLAALSLGLALGVPLPSGASAGSSAVSPVQTSTYTLGTLNPITLGAGTNIGAVSPSNAGVYGGSSTPWNVTNYGKIDGPSGGFYLKSSGSTVTNWGAIGGNDGVGVHLPNGGTLTNESSGSISGYAGVFVGGSAGAVTNAGSITGREIAVLMAAGSFNNVSGGTLSISGASALTVYVGSGGSVTNAGTITNSGSNESAVAIGGGGGGTVTNSGRISATGTLEAAVYTINGGTVTNSGTLAVTGATSAAVYFLDGGTLNNSGNITASGNNNRGVWMPRGGTVTNTGAITDIATGGIGVGAQTGGAIDNQSGGTIKGASAGVMVASGAGSVTNAGEVLATATSGYAVALRGGGTVANTGKVSGAVLGVSISGGSAASNSVTNSGEIYATATNGAGVNLSSGGTVTNRSGGTIAGVAHGVFFAGGTSLLNNAGDIYGTAASGNGAILDSGGLVTNTGKIVGGNFGLYVVGGVGAGTNSGTITGTTLGGVAFVGGGVVTNNSGGTISGGNFGLYIGGGAGTTNILSNTGGIYATGTNSAGVKFGLGGRVTNQGAGKITGVSAGVYIKGGAGSVINAGDINGTAASGNGAVLEGGGALTNTGKITGGGLGVFIAGGGTVDNQSGGTINGGNFGVTIDGGGAATNTLTNTGGIYATGTNSTGLNFGLGGTVTNLTAGKITGVAHGIYIKGGTGSVINAGDINGTAASGNGAVLEGGGALTNTGRITGGSLGVYIAGGGTVDNQSGGTISGGNSGVTIDGGGAATNAGTISGGTASVEFAGPGISTLTLQTGSTLAGAAIGSAASGASNVLILQGQGTANNNFINFNTANVEASGTWTLGGDSTFGDTTVSTGTLAVVGSLTSNSLEILASAQLNDTGSVTVTGAVTNRGNLTINGVTMNVVGAGGTFTQLAGGTTTLLNGGVLDPSNIVIERGVFGGGGSLIGDVSVTGGTVNAGGGPGDSLKFLGNFSQTGGQIVFEIDPSGHGGFLETSLSFDPSFEIGISDTTFVFDFMAGANAQELIADGLLNVNTFLGLTGDGAFCTELNCGRALQDISFADNVPGLTIMGFDPITGAIDSTIDGMSERAAPEPSTWLLLATGMLGLGGLRRLRHTMASRVTQALVSHVEPGGAVTARARQNGFEQAGKDAEIAGPVGIGEGRALRHDRPAMIEPALMARDRFDLAQRPP